MKFEDDMQIEHDLKLDFSDVLIKPKPTELKSRSEVNLEVSYLGKHSNRVITGFPVIVANMSCVATIAMAKALYKYQFFVALHKFITESELIKFYNQEESRNSFYTIGINDDLSKLNNVIKQSKYLNKICLDVANGYMYNFLDYIKKIRQKYPNFTIMAGNVATPEGVENIIKAGADIAKCGIGNGNFCETRNKAGVGYKQFSVAVECGQAANELNALCCSDGGCKSPADICKALGAGSHFVMTGSLFAGCAECDSEWKEENGIKKMLMYGMSSRVANEKYCGGLKEYRSAEGREGWVEYKGSAEHVAIDIRGGVASCCTYTNTKNLENLKKNCIFTIGKNL
jgi:GMP reductase